MPKDRNAESTELLLKTSTPSYRAPSALGKSHRLLHVTMNAMIKNPVQLVNRNKFHSVTISHQRKLDLGLFDPTSWNTVKVNTSLSISSLTQC